MILGPAGPNPDGLRAILVIGVAFRILSRSKFSPPLHVVSPASEL